MLSLRLLLRLGCCCRLCRLEQLLVLLRGQHGRQLVRASSCLVCCCLELLLKLLHLCAAQHSTAQHSA
jgi:hypothetical protein